MVRMNPKVTLTAKMHQREISTVKTKTGEVSVTAQNFNFRENLKFIYFCGISEILKTFL